MGKVWIMTSLLVLFLCDVAGQGITGDIHDQEGAPVPYAAIFIKELTRGTTCNALGQFSLPLPSGSYTIYFRSLGYTEVSRNVEIGNDFVPLSIELPPQTYMIPEVRISASGEDPAYWIMRKAIGLANYHLNEVASYEAEIYIKGTAYIENLPRAIARRIEVNDIRVKENEAYMLESMNEVKFTAPDHYEMRVIASQNTLPGYTENVNPMDYINASLYQQQIESVISPLARNAFIYYNFRFEGTFLEGTYVINQIRVIPKRKSQQLCEGTLYIVEDLWCLHSSDLTVNTIAGTLHLQQLYANVIMDAWLPVNHQIGVNVDIAGVRGDITYVSSLEYHNVILNPNLPDVYFTAQETRVEEADTLLQEEPVSAEEQKIREILEKEELSNRDVSRLSKLMEKEAEKSTPSQQEEDLDQTGTTFSVAENAVRNDSLYWNRVRPIPLTPVEHLTIRERDSIMGARKPSATSDTVQVSVRRKGSPWRSILLGKSSRIMQGRLRYTYGGLLDPEMLGYNTVDGLYYGQQAGIEWWLDSLHTLRSHVDAGYAFHRKAPMVIWDTDLLYGHMSRGKVWLSMAYTSSDFNGDEGIPDFTNMAYTLLMRENYLKKFERIELSLFNRYDLVNGLELITSATIGRKNELENHSDFSIFFRNSKAFTSNVPEPFTPDDPAVSDHRSFSAFVQLSYTPRQPYVIRNHRKELQDSSWPTFRLSYRQAFPMQSTGWSTYSLVEAGFGHQTEVGLLSKLDWAVEAGYFIDRTSVHFSDFKHFKSNPLLIDMAGLDDAYMLMAHYEASTAEYWARADATLTSSYLLIKFLPWFSERLWTESIGLSYLYTPLTPHYVQLGYSLNELFFLADLGAYVAFQEGRYKGFGVRINFRF